MIISHGRPSSLLPLHPFSALISCYSTSIPCHPSAAVIGAPSVDWVENNICIGKVSVPVFTLKNAAPLLQWRHKAPWYSQCTFHVSRITFVSCYYIRMMKLPWMLLCVGLQLSFRSLFQRQELLLRIWRLWTLSSLFSQTTLSSCNRYTTHVSMAINICSASWRIIW